MTQGSQSISDLRTVETSAESKDYCEFCAMKVERWCLPVLLLSYIAVVAIIFGVAQITTGSNRNAPVG